MIKKIITVISLGFMLLGCEISSNEKVSMIIEKSEIPFVQNGTEESSTATQDVASTPFQFNHHCMGISKRSLSSLSLSGSLLIGTPTSTGEKISMELETGIKRNFFVDDLLDGEEFSLSPSGEWIAYIRSESQNKYSLVIQSNDAKEKWVYPWGANEWQAAVSLSYWLNNEKLVLWDHSGDIDHVVLLDAFTGKKTVMDTDYPDLVSYTDYWDSSWPSVTIFSPSLDYLVYLSNNDGQFELGNQRMVLWNKASSDQISTISDFGFSPVWPIWKMDGSGVIYVKSQKGYYPTEKKDELFFLDLNGKNTQITNLSAKYHQARILSYKLSPDENFLAFILQVEVNSKMENKLLILNIGTLEVNDYCFSPEKFSNLVWSPDSRKLAYSQKETDKLSNIVVVDLLVKRASIIAENSQPIFWVSSPLAAGE